MSPMCTTCGHSNHAQRVVALLATLLASLLSGCGTINIQGTVDPGRLTVASPPPDRAAAGVAILMSPQDRSSTESGHPFGSGLKRVVTMPVGALVQTAVLAAFQADFAGPVEPADPEGSSPVSPSLSVLKVSIGQLTYSHGEDLVYFIPLGPLPLERIDRWVRLGFEAQVLDAQGRVTWSRRYDSGRVLVHPVRTGDRPWMWDHDIGSNVQRVAHEQAARLAQLAAHDLRAWFEADRQRERIL